MKLVLIDEYGRFGFYWQLNIYESLASFDELIPSIIWKRGMMQFLDPINRRPSESLLRQQESAKKAQNGNQEKHSHY